MKHQVVSSEDELLILVNEHDEVVGELSKAACHDGEGVLHRAFSVFLFDSEGRLLVQKRSASKRLWPLCWANSCCSHPRVGETLEVATSRRIDQELGVSTALNFAYRFQYHARFKDLGSEHELCSVFLGRVEPNEVSPNAHEIDDIDWLAVSEVDAWMKNEEAQDVIAPWFRLEWHRFRGEYAPILDAFLERVAP